MTDFMQEDRAAQWTRGIRRLENLFDASIAALHANRNAAEILSPLPHTESVP